MIKKKINKNISDKEIEKITESGNDFVPNDENSIIFKQSKEKSVMILKKFIQMAKNWNFYVSLG